MKDRVGHTRCAMLLMTVVKEICIELVGPQLGVHDPARRSHPHLVLLRIYDIFVICIILYIGRMRGNQCCKVGYSGCF